MNRQKITENAPATVQSGLESFSLFVEWCRFAREKQAEEDLPIITIIAWKIRMGFGAWSFLILCLRLFCSFGDLQIENKTPA